MSASRFSPQGQTLACTVHAHVDCMLLQVCEHFEDLHRAGVDDKQSTEQTDELLREAVLDMHY